MKQYDISKKAEMFYCYKADTVNYSFNQEFRCKNSN